MYFIRLALFGMLLLGAATHPLLKVVVADEVKPDPKLSVAVLGVACDSENKQWRDGLVGFGLQALVTQALYDTGRYRIFEENSEVLNRLQPRVRVTFEQAAKRKTGDLKATTQALKADLVTVGRVSTFSTQGQNSAGSKMVFSGPRPGTGFKGPAIQTKKRETKVKVELCLFNARTGQTISKVEGTGDVAHGSTAIIADLGPGGLPFDPSLVEPATREAVEHAVAKLFPGVRQRPILSGVPPILSNSITIGVIPVTLKSEIAELYPTLKQKRVTLGIHNRIAKTVSATDKCQLQEVNPEVLQALELQYWTGKTGVAPTENLSNHTSSLNSNLNWIVYGEVFSFSVRTIEKLRGVSGKVNNEVMVGVQLRAINSSEQPPYCFVASGTGKAIGDWEAFTGSEVDFEQTLVGRAASGAIQEAWRNLLRDLAKRDKEIRSQPAGVQ